MLVPRTIPTISRQSLVSLSPSLVMAGALLLGAGAIAFGGSRIRQGGETAIVLVTLGLAVIALANAVLVLRRMHDLEQQRVRLVDQLALATTRSERLADATDGALLIVDREGTITGASTGTTELIGRYPWELTCKPFADIFGSEDSHRTASWLASAMVHGSCRMPRIGLAGIGFGERWLSGSMINRQDDPALQATIVTLREVSAAVRLEQQLNQQRDTDPLTGLLNRRAFLELWEVRTNPEAMLVLIDLADFGSLNATHGAQAGDAVLRVIAHRLQQEIGADEAAARMDGDCFGMILSGDAARLEPILERVFGPLIALGTQDLTVRAHTGYATADLIAAEAALRMAQTEGSTIPLGFGSTEIDHETWEPTVSDLRIAVQNEDFVLHYQPIVALATGLVTEYEALVRWHHPEHGLIGPDRFISLAEECEVIRPLTWWVIDAACQQGAAWLAAQPHAPVAISVNLSARMLTEPDLVERLSLALCRHCFPARLLRLELVERALIGDVRQAAAVLQAIKSIGVQLAIDDFGTGFSSLAYLHHFPVDVIKIDRSFVAAMSTSSASTEIVRTIVELAQRLQIETTGEGIETAEQLEKLRALGSGHGQGYFFARPMAASEITLGPMAITVGQAA